MKRRGFLGMLAALVAAPLAKLLPTRSPGAATQIKFDARETMLLLSPSDSPFMAMLRGPVVDMRTHEVVEWRRGKLLHIRPRHVTQYRLEERDT